MANQYEVTATALNLRAAASGASGILTVLRSGQVCVASGDAAGGWLPAVFGRFSGFVSAAFVRPLGAPPGAVATPPAAVAPPTAAPLATAPSPEVKLRDRAQLHPLFRNALDLLLQQVAAEAIPFRVFEAFRTPERQQWLYAQGRTRPGSVVTKAQAWQSFHQFGLAVDLVLFIDGQWSWSSAGALGGHWTRLRDIARQVGLRTLDWEAPHVEWPVPLAEAAAATMVARGDEGWIDNLQEVSTRWRRAGGVGAPDLVAAERPPLP